MKKYIVGLLATTIALAANSMPQDSKYQPTNEKAADIFEKYSKALSTFDDVILCTGAADLLTKLKSPIIDEPIIALPGAINQLVFNGSTASAKYVRERWLALFTIEGILSTWGISIIEKNDSQ